jgi:3'-phosphoadenosine 5'-phosphosulfate sulfotransferase
MQCLTVSCLTPTQPSKKGTTSFKDYQPKHTIIKTSRVEEIRAHIDNHKRAQAKIRMLTEWSRRSIRSTMKDLEDILETLEEDEFEF